MQRRLLALLFGFAFVFAAPAAHAAGDFDFNGDWQGVIKFDKEVFVGTGIPPIDGMPAWLEIHDGVVDTVFKGGDDVVRRQGGFSFAQQKSNAVMFGTHHSAAGDDGIYWVETWTFTVAMEDHDHMRVEFSRMVRNVGLKPDDESYVFSTRGGGDFSRMTTAPPKPSEGVQ